MTIRKVHQGDRLAISARDWNAIASHVNGEVHVPSECVGSGRERIAIYNATGKDLLMGMTVKLVATRHKDNLPLDFPLFEAAIPSSYETDFIPAVMATSAKKEQCGLAVVSGIAPVRIASGNGLYGSPDGKGSLILADSGLFMVIPNAKSTIWKHALLGGGIGANAQKGPFDSELVQEKDEDEWKLTCIDTLARQNAGIVFSGTHRETIAARSWNVTQAGVLFLDILYTPSVDDTGNGTYSINVFFETELPAPIPDERRIVVRLAEVRGDRKNGFRLLKYREPGDYTVTGRWVR